MQDLEWRKQYVNVPVLRYEAQSQDWKATQARKRAGLFTKPQVYRMGGMLKVWDMIWRRRAEVNLEINVQRDKARDMEHHVEQISQAMRGIKKYFVFFKSVQISPTIGSKDQK